jgi:hypothetical protein
MLDKNSSIFAQFLGLFSAIQFVHVVQKSAPKLCYNDLQLSSVMWPNCLGNTDFEATTIEICFEIHFEIHAQRPHTHSTDRVGHRRQHWFGYLQH